MQTKILRGFVLHDSCCGEMKLAGAVQGDDEGTKTRV